MATAPTAEIVECTNAAYHADRSAWSHSQLDVLIEDGPEMFEGRFITGRFPSDFSDDLDLGDVVHQIINDGRSIADTIIEIPDSALTSNGQRRGKAWEEFKAAHADRLPLKAAQVAAVCDMCQSVRLNPLANRILNAPGGKSEVTIRWQDEHCGLGRRARLDRFNPRMIADFKTSFDCSPREFPRQCLNFGYHRQAAYYQDAAEALTGERLPFVFIAVRKSAPFTCSVFQLDSEFVGLGAQENLAGLSMLADCLRNGVWQSPSAGTLITVKAPKWAFNTENWSTL